MNDILIKDVDLKLLNEQRKLLVDLIWNDQDTDLWGLVDMLDYIIDTYGTENR